LSLGVKPYALWIEARIADLGDAIARCRAWQAEHDYQTTDWNQHQEVMASIVSYAREIIALAELPPRQRLKVVKRELPRWRPETDRPGPGIMVLLCTAKGAHLIGFWDEGSGWLVPTRMDLEEGTVTHWMPLPALPESVRHDHHPRQ
jgi:hypothetical protein